MTHYERLGVGRDATPDEVRAAYRRAARRLHPDTGGDGTAGAMADVNQAWRVLGDAQRRRDYDVSLGEPDDAVSGSAAPASPVGREWATVGTPHEPARNPLARYQDPPRFPWRFMGMLAVLGIAVVGLGLALRSPVKPLPVDNVLGPGSCVVLRPNGDAAEVECAAEHDGVVEVLVSVGEPCPPGTEPHRDQQGMGTACIRFTG